MTAKVYINWNAAIMMLLVVSLITSVCCFGAFLGIATSAVFVPIGVRVLCSLVAVLLVMLMRPIMSLMLETWRYL